MPQVQGKFEVQTSMGSVNTITLDGDSGTISSSDVTVYNSAGKEKVRLSAERASAISVQDDIGKRFLDISDFGSPPTGGGGACGLLLGADKDPGGNKAGHIVLRDNAGNRSIYLDGRAGNLTLVDEDGHPSLFVRGKASGIVDGDVTGIWVGDKGSIDWGGEAAKAGFIAIRDTLGNDSIVIDGFNNSMTLKGKAGRNSIVIDGVKGDITLDNADCAEGCS
jgi:hypothetical protein